jgi:uncharacterized protein YcfJ
MIKMVALLGLFASVAGSANAETYNTVGTVIDVQPEYAQVTTSVPTETCRNVQSGGNVGDTIAGAIIGGAIGNQFGNGNGKDAMTVLGAIVGANRASNRTVDQIVGYRIEQQCDNVARSVNEPVISSYHIEYVFNGYTYRQETTQEYTLGQRVLVQPALR